MTRCQCGGDLRWAVSCANLTHQQVDTLTQQLAEATQRIATLEARVKCFEDAGGVTMSTRIFDEMRRREEAEALLRQRDTEKAALEAELERREPLVLAGLVSTLTRECEKQHARAEQAEATLTQREATIRRLEREIEERTSKAESVDQEPFGHVDDHTSH